MSKSRVPSKEDESTLRRLYSTRFDLTLSFFPCVFVIFLSSSLVFHFQLYFLLTDELSGMGMVDGQCLFTLAWFTFENRGGLMPSFLRIVEATTNTIPLISYF